jgi:hypothetical protein
MLELRPSCEHCNVALPPASADARICSFECTFCARCVDEVLEGVCPNCGGGFVPRPVRPVTDWRGGNSLDGYPASDRVRHRPVDRQAHAELVARVGGIPAGKR